MSTTVQMHETFLSSLQIQSLKNPVHLQIDVIYACYSEREAVGELLILDVCTVPIIVEEIFH